MSFVLFLHVPHVTAVGVAGQSPVESIVNTAWLAQHLKDPDVAVISSDDLADFTASHIPGARVVPHERTLGGDHRLLAADALARVLSEAGATDKTHVVLYGNSPMATGWLYMAFATLGHADRVSFLNGNLALWRAEERQMATGAAPPAPGGRLTPRPASDIVVDADWVRDRLEKPGVSVLDVRTTREWNAGRLPGATLVLWQDLYVPGGTGRFKSQADIRALLARAGVKSGDQVVTYCAVGMRASLMYFVATRLAGLPGRVYVGSMEDWQRRGFPTVK